MKFAMTDRLVRIGVKVGHEKEEEKTLLEYEPYDEDKITELL